MPKGEGLKMIKMTISNIKGGVAKTTTAATLAAGLQRKGKRVLAIDSDPQTNLTMCFVKENEDMPTLYQLYANGSGIKDIRTTVKQGLDIVAGDFTLCSADMEFLAKVGSLKLLSKALKEVEKEYDYVIIDTPPNLGFLSLNSFMASDYVITPMAADSFSLKAIRLLKKTIDDVAEEAGKEIPVAGILLTRYTDRTNIARALEDNVNSAAKMLDTKVFNSRIRQATVIQESQLMRKDIFEYAPKAPVTADYEKFIKELLKITEGK